MTKDASREDKGQFFRKEGRKSVRMGFRKRFRHWTAELGRHVEEASALGAVLVITLAHFAFGSQPVVGFVARLKSAALG